MAINGDGEMIQGGRPHKKIDKKAFENLCSLQCTKEEMCGFFDVDEKTLTGWCQRTYGMGFSEIYKRKSASGKMSLRRMQFRTAEEGNPTMQIWLGKQYLGQTDVMKQSIDVSEQESDEVNEMQEYIEELKRENQNDSE